MHLRNSTRLQKASKKSPKRKPSPDEDVLRHKVGEKRRRTRTKKTKPTGDGAVKTDKPRRDILDLISSRPETDRVAEEDEGASVEIPDEGLDGSNDDGASVSSSVCSGPSLLYRTRPSQVPCSACQKLYQKAGRMKAPIKNKLLDNDPKSLTCDQWVLIKKRRLANMSNAEGKRLVYIQERLQRRKVKRCEQSPACSRPHIYLKRNLRRRVQVQERKANRKEQEKQTNKRRKRSRDDSEVSRVAKQQRLHSNVHHQHIGSVDGGHRSSSEQNSMNGFEDCSDQEINAAGPSSVISTTTKDLLSRQTPKKSKSGFRDLLIQLRGNSSMIVREKH